MLLKTNIKMIVCHCGVVTYEDLVKSLEGGSKTLEDLREDTGCCADCCGCEKAIKALLEEARGAPYWCKAKIKV